MTIIVGFYLVIFVVIAAAYQLVIKQSVSAIHPDLVAAVSGIVWVLILFIPAGFQLKSLSLTLGFKPWIPVILLGVIGGFMTFFNYRITSALPVSYVIIARASAPAFALLGARLFFKETLSKGILVGMSIVLVGIFIVGYFYNQESS